MSYPQFDAVMADNNQLRMRLERIEALLQRLIPRPGDPAPFPMQQGHDWYARQPAPQYAAARAYTTTRPFPVGPEVDPGPPDWIWRKDIAELDLVSVVARLRGIDKARINLNDMKNIQVTDVMEALSASAAARPAKRWPGVPFPADPAPWTGMLPPLLDPAPWWFKHHGWPQGDPSPIDVTRIKELAGLDLVRAAEKLGGMGEGEMSIADIEKVKVADLLAGLQPDPIDPPPYWFRKHLYDLTPTLIEQMDVEELEVKAHALKTEITHLESLHKLVSEQAERRRAQG